MSDTTETRPETASTGASSRDEGENEDDHDGDHDHAGVEPVTDHVHDTSWSANLEKPQHADDRSLVVAQAIEAVEHTEPGNHVNLVTHGAHGHPETYLFDALEEALDARNGDECEYEYEYVDQCGCGGHVTRVEVR